MKTVLFFSMMTFFSVNIFSQEKDSIDYGCNDKWLDELIKSDTITPKYRNQDFMCYLSVFDSIKNPKSHSLPELYIAVGRLIKFSDGAFAEGLGASGYDLFINDPALFFTNMKSIAKESDYSHWALLLFYESRIRFEYTIKPHEIIEKLNIDEMLKSKKGYQNLEKQIYIQYAAHLKN